MKNKKVSKTIIIILCILVILNIVSLGYLYIITNSEISGKFIFTTKNDTEFDISVDAPLLYRKVEMVQYHKDDSGNVEMVFSDKPIESFDSYVNPDFPQDITSKIFYENTTLDGKSLSLDSAIDIINSDIEMVRLDSLSEDGGSEFGLVCQDNAYISASNEWNIGEIRVTFYYLDPNKTYSIKGIVNNNVIDRIDSIINN